MTTWFLAFLGLIWIAVFVPGAVRARRRTPLPAATRFKRVMASIAPPKPPPRHLAPRPAPAERTARSDSGRWIIVPHSSERATSRAAFARTQRRRRRWLGTLLAGVVASGAGAVLVGGPWFEIHLMIDALTIFYIAMLFESKRRRDEQVTKVRPIAPAQRYEEDTSDSSRASGALF